MKITEFNKQKRIEDYIVKRVNIVTTNFYTYAVYEKTTGTFITGFEHSTIMRIDGNHYGRMGTRNYTQEEYDKAYNIIERAFPEAKKGVKDMGGISVYWDENIKKEVLNVSTN